MFDDTTSEQTSYYPNNGMNSWMQSNQCHNFKGKTDETAINIFCCNQMQSYKE